MDDLIAWFDILGTLAFGVAILYAARLPRPVMDPIPKAFLLAFLATYLLVMAMNSLEHAGITAKFDRFEDPLEIMFLPFFFFFVFSLKSSEEFRRRAKAERTLAEQGEFLSRLLGTIPHGVEEIDRDGVITYANPALHAIYGYAPGELLGRSILELSRDAETAEKLRQYLRFLSLEQPAPTPWNGRDARKDGALVDVQVDWDYKRDGEGRVVGFIAAITDVTHRQRMADELARSERRFRQLVENAGDSFVIVDRHGKIIEVNQQAVASTGYSRSELLTMYISDLDLDYPPEKEAGRVWEALQYESCRTFTGMHRRKDGSTFPVEVQAALIDYLDNKAIFGIIRDISARLAAESTMRVQAQIIDQTHDAVATADLNGTITSWNHGAEELLGYQSLEAVGKDISAFYTPGQRRFLRREIIHPLLAKGNHELELDVARKDGSLIHGHMSLSLLRNRQGRPSGVVVYLLDVTARKAAEQELRLSEERLRLALASGRQGMYDLNLVSGEAVVNDEYGGMLGYARGEFAFNIATWLASIHPDDRERVERYFNDYVARGTGEAKVEYRQRTKDGRWKWILSLGRIVAWDKDGRSLRMLGTHTDLTEEKEAQEILARERAQLYSLLGGLPGFVCLQAEDFTIRFANSYFTEHFGDPAGKRCFEALHQGVEPCRNCDIVDVLREGRKRTWEWLDAPDGRVYQIYDFPFQDFDGSQMVLKFGIDITERKAAELEKINLEKQLLYHQKMESLGAMAGGIAHDFNNLLMAIMGNTDLAMMALPGDSPAREQLKASKAASLRAADLCKQMLAYSGRGAFALVQIDLSRFIEESEHLLEVAVAKRSTISLDLAKDMPPIDADPLQLRQLLVNIVTNAAEAIEGGGSIHIHTYAGPCEATAQSCPYQTELPMGRCVMLRVTDSGCGMDLETTARLFDPFFTTKFTGRGLGMAAALGIVRAHHGAIEVESVPGKGTTVIVSLPVSSRWQARTGEGPAVQSASRDERPLILLVDDEKEVLDVADAMLGMLGYRVLMARDGQECLEVYQQHASAVKAVLLDLAMPRMNGIEAFRHLRRLNSNLPVILSSGYSKEQAAEAIQGNGLAAFIQKPYNVEQLRQVLASLSISPH
ncbi:MAG: PAS domain-containing hybrid sensor histidine kinase/response regulator [Thermodesulfobacteriota bacterium]